MSSPSPDSHTNSPSLSQKYSVMEKENRVKETRSNKSIAILTQQVELLQLQLQEFKEREVNMKRLHNTMWNALSAEDKNTVPHELEIVAHLHQTELLQAKERNATIVQSLEGHVEELISKNSELEEQLREVEQHNRELVSQAQQRIQVLENSNHKLDQEYKKIGGEKTELSEKLDYDMQSKMADFQEIIDKLKTEHSKEIEQCKNQSENALKDMKYIYEQEKLMLEGRLEKFQSSVKLLEMQKDANSATSMQDLQNHYLGEIQELNFQITKFKKESYAEIQNLKKQRDDALKKVEIMEISLKKIKHSIRTSQNIQDQSQKTLTTKLERAKQLLEVNENTNLKIKNAKKQISQLRNHVTKLETSEKNLRTALESSRNQFEADKFRIIKTVSGNTKFKESFDNKQANLLQEMVHKDENIARLSQQLDETRRELSYIQQNTMCNKCSMSVSGVSGMSEWNSNSLGVWGESETQGHNVEKRARCRNGSGFGLYTCQSACSRRSSQPPQRRTECTLNGKDSHTLGATFTSEQFKLLRDKEFMVDNSTQMCCRECGAFVDTPLFRAHLSEQCRVEGGPTASQDGSNIWASVSEMHNHPKQPLPLIELPTNTNTSKLSEEDMFKEELNILKSEKTSLENKLENTEGILHDMSSKMEILKSQRDKVQVELDRLVHELKEAKKKWSGEDKERSGEKSESEMTLKTEIKFLINKLNKAKNKLASNGKSSGNPCSPVICFDQLNLTPGCMKETPGRREENQRGWESPNTESMESKYSKHSKCKSQGNRTQVHRITKNAHTHNQPVHININKGDGQTPKRKQSRNTGNSHHSKGVSQGGAPEHSLRIGDPLDDVSTIPEKENAGGHIMFGGTNNTNISNTNNPTNKYLKRSSCGGTGEVNSVIRGDTSNTSELNSLLPFSPSHLGSVVAVHATHYQRDLQDRHLIHSTADSARHSTIPPFNTVFYNIPFMK